MIWVYLLAIGIVMWYVFYKMFSSNLVYTKSSYDGRSYLVRNLPDKDKAADLIAKTREKLTSLCSRMSDRYPNNKRVKIMVRRFNPNNLSESEQDSAHTSYSLNKGERIILCIRSKDASNALIDENTVAFVALHELAHVMTLSIGHTKEFWDNFRFILANAIFFKLYTPQNFEEDPQPYCGTHITNSPLQLQDVPKYVRFEDVAGEAPNEARAVRS
jgi:hypothetical protein